MGPLTDPSNFSREKALKAIDALRKVFTISTAAFRFAGVVQDVSGGQEQRATYRMRALHEMLLSDLTNAEALNDADLIALLERIDGCLAQMEEEAANNARRN